MRTGRASKALQLVSISWLDLYPARSGPARRLLLMIHEAHHSARLFLQSRPQMPIFVACVGRRRQQELRQSLGIARSSKPLQRRRPDSRVRHTTGPNWLAERMRAMAHQLRAGACGNLKVIEDCGQCLRRRGRLHARIRKAVRQRRRDRRSASDRGGLQIATALELFRWCPFKRAAGSGDALPFGSNRSGCH
jgi:hypothetical protein